MKQELNEEIKVACSTLTHKHHYINAAKHPGRNRLYALQLDNNI